MKPTPKAFAKLVKQVLLKKFDARPKAENKRPSQAEVKQKWKLEKDAPKR